MKVKLSRRNQSLVNSRSIQYRCRVTLCPPATGRVSVAAAQGPATWAQPPGLTHPARSSSALPPPASPCPTRSQAPPACPDPPTQYPVQLKQDANEQQASSPRLCAGRCVPALPRQHRDALTPADCAGAGPPPPPLTSTHTVGRVAHPAPACTPTCGSQRISPE